MYQNARNLIACLTGAATVAPLPGAAQTCANPGTTVAECELVANYPSGGASNYVCYIKTYNCDGTFQSGSKRCDKNCETCNSWPNSATGFSQCEAYCRSNVRLCGTRSPLLNTCCTAGQTCDSATNACACPSQSIVCGSNCCAPGQVCLSGVCVTPRDCEGPRCKCDPLAVGDPVNIAGGNSVLRSVDSQLSTLRTKLEFNRTYSSNGAGWSTELTATVPKPFGATPTVNNSLQWWHNFYSFVHKEGTNWRGRDRDGRGLSFKTCTTAPCWASPSQTNASISERLQWQTNGGFALLQADGTRSVYEAAWNPPGGAISH